MSPYPWVISCTLFIFTETQYVKNTDPQHIVRLRYVAKILMVICLHRIELQV